MLTRLDQTHDLTRCALFIMLVHGHRAGANAKRIEQPAGMPGVLRGNEVHRSQDARRATTDICQISERRGDHVQ